MLKRMLDKMKTFKLRNHIKIVASSEDVKVELLKKGKVYSYCIMNEGFGKAVAKTMASGTYTQRPIYAFML